MEIEAGTFDGIKSMMASNGESSAPTSGSSDGVAPKTSDQQPKTDEQERKF